MRGVRDLVFVKEGDKPGGVVDEVIDIPDKRPAIHRDVFAVQNDVGPQRVGFTRARYSMKKLDCVVGVKSKRAHRATPGCSRRGAW